MLRIRYCGSLCQSGNASLADYIKWDRQKDRFAVVVIGREGGHFNDSENTIANIRNNTSSFFECLLPNCKLLQIYGMHGPYKEGDF
jgi:hypothetical protein